MSQQEAQAKKKRLSEDQWANVVAQGFLLPEPDGDIRYSLVWEEATRAFWRYGDGHWTMLTEADALRLVRARIIMSEPFTMSRGRDVTAQLRYEVQACEELDDTWIAFDDGSWNPATEEFLPHAPSRVATSRVRCAWASLPDWKEGADFGRFVEAICVGPDGKPLPEMALLLQEMFGYVLYPSAERAVTFFLSGEGRNGKGVLLRLLRRLVSRERTSNFSLTELTSSRFATSGLVGMRVNVADETNTAREAVSDLLKKLVAVDEIQVERKFSDSFRSKLKVKYFFNVNGVPSFDSFGYAMRERIVAVPFFRSFGEGERDFGLAERMTASEMPHVAAWAVEGLRRLKANGMRFTTYAEREELLDSFEKLSDPLTEFLDGWERSAEPTAFWRFYVEFAEWCKDNGRKVPSSKKVAIRVNAKFGKSKNVWDWPQSVRHDKDGKPVGAKASVAGVNLARKPEPVEPKPLPSF